jgi:phosphatidylethanolamine-binding protein (PEBP) family uncharacterized protein
VSTPPLIDVTLSELTVNNGKLPPDRRFMVFMIDIDVVTNRTATTILHWFQPHLVPNIPKDKVAAFLNLSQPVNLIADNVILASSPPEPPAVQKTNNVLPIVSSQGVVPNSRQSSSVSTDVGNAGANPPGPLSPVVMSNSPAVAPKAPSGPPDPSASPSIRVPLAQTVYLPPSPPPGPAHRYVLLLFAQPANLTIPPCFSNVISVPGSDPLVDLQGRVGFDLSAFLAATGASNRAIAGNYFRAENPAEGSLTVPVTATSLRRNNCAPATKTPPPKSNVPPALGPKMVESGQR